VAQVRGDLLRDQSLWQRAEMQSATTTEGLTQVLKAIYTSHKPFSSVVGTCWVRMDHQGGATPALHSWGNTEGLTQIGLEQHPCDPQILPSNGVRLFSKQGPWKLLRPRLPELRFVDVWHPTAR